MYIIKKDRLSNFVPRYSMRVAAAVQLCIAIPPLPYLRTVRSGVRARRS